MNPIEALERVAYLQDRGLMPAQKTAAFLKAAQVLRDLPSGELERRISGRSLTGLPGIGPSTAAVIEQAAAGRIPQRILDLEESTRIVQGAGAELRSKLRGDCHTHSTWSDGGAPIRTMAETARTLGHDYLVMTDHSPRLTVARGLTRERRFAQFDEIETLNVDLAPFRILAGIEVDILDDGSLDCDEDILQRLDIVVASVHSKLTMDAAAMTRRMLAAVRNPAVDILGHCTGRKLTGNGPGAKLVRPQSKFDARKVFAACAEAGTAVEINSRPERQDPPDDLLALALDAGCSFAIDTDAHAPGQLEFVSYGSDRAHAQGIGPDRVVNCLPADDLLAWRSR